jgi:hypothetical protein
MVASYPVPYDVDYPTRPRVQAYIGLLIDQYPPFTLS